MTLVSNLLLGLGGGVQLVDEQIFTTTGTWNKPVAADPDDMAEILVWAAGGFASSSGDAGGGACNRQFVRVRDLAASVPAVVAPATTSGNGGTSEFGKIKAYGGAAGGPTLLGAGGGTLGPPNSGMGGPPGGGSSDSQKIPPGPFGGGAQNGTTWGVNHTEYGGAGGRGNSIWGGAGGSGKSIFGGDGATADSDAQAPGGGGSPDGPSSRRIGARGEIRVRIWRGI